jgi:hypothetical protein
MVIISQHKSTGSRLKRHITSSAWIYSGVGYREAFSWFPSTSSLLLKTRKGKVPNQMVIVHLGPSFKAVEAEACAVTSACAQHPPEATLPSPPWAAASQLQWLSNLRMGTRKWNHCHLSPVKNTDFTCQKEPDTQRTSPGWEQESYERKLRNLHPLARKKTRAYILPVFSCAWPKQGGRVCGYGSLYGKKKKDLAEGVHSAPYLCAFGKLNWPS